MAGISRSGTTRFRSHLICLRWSPAILRFVEDTFRTLSGRDVTLRIYVEPGKQDRCSYAMDSLKRAMRWDEEKFGREYDLDIFMIVAVSDFNMGAMENKGLNVFNDKYILASPETATDADYAAIEAIVAHEYFHNWTGNRITCRDWFQLCLKEGLTVFRDQEFTSDERSRPVERIKDVRGLRAHQFVEDAGPLAHPVRPATYHEINNFYTATVYEKGAEVVRMLKGLLGDDNFRKGMDLYFARHDGEAATVDQFVQCFADAAGVDLTQFMLWYSQAGTPELVVTGTHDMRAKTYRLDIAQTIPPTPEQPSKEPMTIPLVPRAGRTGRERSAAVALPMARRSSAGLSRSAGVPKASRLPASPSARCPRSTADFPRRCGSSPISATRICASSPCTTAIPSTAGRRCIPSPRVSWSIPRPRSGAAMRRSTILT